jgi:DNA-dependent RNA polymerase auxiliary subunit epsilon
LYLVITERGRTRQLYVPKDGELRVRRWVEDYHQARQLMEEVSRLHWNKVRERQD